MNGMNTGTLRQRQEIWKDIKGYDGLYQISNLGRVKSLLRKDIYGRIIPEKILKQSENKCGYLRVHLYKDGISKFIFVHKLVALSFLPNPKKLDETNHKDEIKTNNNDCNLEWCTRKYNVNYGNRTQKASNAIKGKNGPMYGIKGGKHPASKKVIQYTLNGEFIKKWDCIKDIEMKLGIKSQNISKICKNKGKTAKGFIWKYANEVI